MAQQNGHVSTLDVIITENVLCVALISVWFTKRKEIEILTKKSGLKENQQLDYGDFKLYTND
jgi:hypothetical protein